MSSFIPPVPFVADHEIVASRVSILSSSLFRVTSRKKSLTDLTNNLRYTPTPSIAQIPTGHPSVGMMW